MTASWQTWRLKAPGCWLLRSAWSQQRDQPVSNLIWCLAVAPRISTQPGGFTGSSPRLWEPMPSAPPPAKRNRLSRLPSPTRPTREGKCSALVWLGGAVLWA
ncbi:hypothetical protein QJQ45_018296 [Haematococcus lacustris]|nr:hypothetical protein QJQ45_018296 [Haematococcus lacustris]